MAGYVIVCLMCGAVIERYGEGTLSITSLCDDCSVCNGKIVDLVRKIRATEEDTLESKE